MRDYWAIRSLFAVRLQLVNRKIERTQHSVCSQESSGSSIREDQMEGFLDSIRGPVVEEQDCTYALLSGGLGS